MPDDITCTEPSFKAHILLQAQLVRSSLQGAFELPVVDYWLDLVTIIDAAIRITVATVEIALAKRLAQHCTDSGAAFPGTCARSVA